MQALCPQTRSKCQTFETVKQDNADIPDMVYVTVPQAMVDAMRKAWNDAGQDWPEAITTVRVGLTEHYADQVFLFAFDKDGCFNFLTHMSKTRFQEVVGKGA